MSIPENVSPAPGSPAAVRLGCSCPVIDNAHGEGYRGVPGSYVYVLDCRLHGLGATAVRRPVEVGDARAS